MSAIDEFFPAATQPYRDELGYTSHPGLDNARWRHPSDPELIDLAALRDAGVDVRLVAMEGDLEEGDVLQVTYYADGDPDIRGWNPTPPEGEGWRLVSIFDDEDGPEAMFVRDRQVAV